MMDTRIVTIIVLITLPICYSDYTENYIDEEDYLQNSSILQNNSSNSYARQKGVNVKFGSFNIDNKKQSIIIDFYYKKRDRKKLRVESAVAGKAKQILNVSLTAKKSCNSSNETMPPTVINIFKDYSYNYEDNSCEPQDETENIELHSLPDVSIGRNDDDYVPHFYNLEPAMDETFSSSYKETTSENTWYLAQNLPCFEMPVLYGELRRKTKSRNVFSIFKDKLINVIEPMYYDNMSVARRFPVRPVLSLTVNKWCEIEPCYGDHTLCLFNTDEIPASCGDHYKVHVPTVLEQIAIVNTVNAMRNRVANREALRYMHLPPASNMNQVEYSVDLQDMAEKWLKQCLPGSAPCAALDGYMVTELQCTKFGKHCCHQQSATSECKAKPECYVFSIIGCIHLWFWKAGRRLIGRDVRCGKASVATFPTVQLLWAATSKIGCAYARSASKDVRVVCNFSPGAPFFINTKLFCGILSLQNPNRTVNLNITVDNFTKSLRLQWQNVSFGNYLTSRHVSNPLLSKRLVNNIYKYQKNLQYTKFISLNKIFKEGWVRDKVNSWANSTISWFAVIVSRHTFLDETHSKCDDSVSIYVPGETGVLCKERGRTYYGLCDAFSDPTNQNRLISVIVSIILFLLVLYDLFSGIVRQNN